MKIIPLFFLSIIFLFSCEFPKVKFTVRNTTDYQIDSMYIANQGGDTVRIEKITPYSSETAYLVFEKEITNTEAGGFYQYKAWKGDKKSENTSFCLYTSYNVHGNSQHFLIEFKEDTVEIFKKEFVSIAKDAWEINEEGDK